MSRHHNARAQRAARRALAPLVAAGVARCRRCDQLVEPGQPWDAGHSTDLALGGSATGPTFVEHARRDDCPAGGNRSAGAVLGNQLRAAPRRRLAAWLELVDPDRLGDDDLELALIAPRFFGPAIARTTPRVFFSLPRNLTIGPGSAGIGPAAPKILRCEP